MKKRDFESSILFNININKSVSKGVWKFQRANEKILTKRNTKRRILETVKLFCPFSPKNIYDETNLEENTKKYLRKYDDQ